MLAALDDVSGDITSNSTGAVLVAMVALLAASVGGAWWFSRRDPEHRPVAWFMALGSIAGCLAVTLAREGFPREFRLGDALSWMVSGWDRLAYGDILGSSQFLLNVALFVPAGAAWAWLTRRPLRCLVGLAALTALIESTQAVTGLGAADITDVAANAMGAALGVAAGTVVRRVVDRTQGVHRQPLRARTRMMVAGGVAAATSALVAALFAGAGWRQAAVHDELVDAFGATTYDEIAAVLMGNPDDPDRLAPDARYRDSEEIFDAISVRINGNRYAENRIELRWPALFLGLRRCVYVIWTPVSVEFDDRSGSECTEFIG